MRIANNLLSGISANVLAIVCILSIIGIFSTAMAASDDNSAGFTEKSLKNATYNISGENVTFKNGHYEEAGMPPSSMDIDMIALGDLNNDNIIDAAIVYRLNENWTSLTLMVVINDHGKPLVVAEKGLCMYPGDGFHFVKKVSIKNGIITVNMLTHKKGDVVSGVGWVPPTVNSTFKFKLVGKRLVDLK